MSESIELIAISTSLFWIVRFFIAIVWTNDSCARDSINNSVNLVTANIVSAEATLNSGSNFIMAFTRLNGKLTRRGSFDFSGTAAAFSKIQNFCELNFWINSTHILNYFSRTCLLCPFALNHCQFLILPFPAQFQIQFPIPLFLLQLKIYYLFKKKLNKASKLNFVLLCSTDSIFLVKNSKLFLIRLFILKIKFCK